MWIPTPIDTYRSAIYDEGKLTLSVVTKYLYEGGIRRPDLYFKSKFGEGKYKNTFNKNQRSTLESYLHCPYNIRCSVKDYDISLHYKLQEHVCGLKPKGHIDWLKQGTLEYLLRKVHKNRNYVSHKNLAMSEHELREKLIELRKLYGDILNQVARRINCSINSDRSRIMNGLKRKFPSNSAAKSHHEREKRVRKNKKEKERKKRKKRKKDTSCFQTNKLRHNAMQFHDASEHFISSLISNALQTSNSNAKAHHEREREDNSCYLTNEYHYSSVQFCEATECLMSSLMNAAKAHHERETEDSSCFPPTELNHGAVQLSEARCFVFPLQTLKFTAKAHHERESEDNSCFQTNEKLHRLVQFREASIHFVYLLINWLDFQKRVI